MLLLVRYLPPPLLLTEAQPSSLPVLRMNFSMSMAGAELQSGMEGRGTAEV